MITSLPRTHGDARRHTSIHANDITTPYLGGVWGGLEIGEFPITGWGVEVGGSG